MATHYDKGDANVYALVDSLSNEKQVTTETPPTFLVYGTLDNVVPVKFYKITDNCVGHGFGYNGENWGEAGYTWLKTGGYLDATGPVSIAAPKAKVKFVMNPAFMHSSNDENHALRNAEGQAIRNPFGVRDGSRHK
jgi:hypothetical protein